MNQKFPANNEMKDKLSKALKEKFANTLWDLVVESKTGEHAEVKDVSIPGHVFDDLNKPIKGLTYWVRKTLKDKDLHVKKYKRKDTNNSTDTPIAA